MMKMSETLHQNLNMIIMVKEQIQEIKELKKINNKKNRV